MAFELLSEPVRRYVKDKRWEGLRPIQVAAITKIMGSNDNYILASKTASGKTEAAFLPILSKIKKGTASVQVLYISPLIALINDQFIRVEDLCTHLDIKVTKWHGEANRTAKEHLIKDPDGVVLITPESIEAMLINRPYYVKTLFNHLQYIIIDEIHSFIGTDRGMQLKSLLHRLQQSASCQPSIIGLSATIGRENFQRAKEMTGRPEETTVLIDKAAKKIVSRFHYFESSATGLSLDLLKDLYKNTYDKKVLVFPNSRGRAEEVAVKLKRIAEKVGGHSSYFSHHSSVDKELRESIEYFAKNNKHQPFLISCTSTLELGIDIGSVEKVVQLDATHSIASLIQRVGRSGRRDDDESVLLLYSTHPWSLLQSLACWLLYKDAFIEPTYFCEKPFDILVHQILSLVKEKQGLGISALNKEFAENFAFKGISGEEFDKIIQHLLHCDLLEKLGAELIIGIEGEKVANTKDFYTVFTTEPNFKVIHAGKTIGEIPLSPQIIVNENMLLAARIWKIADIDYRAKKIFVTPTNDGRPPIFGGDGGNVHVRIRIKMLEVLLSESDYAELDKSCREEIHKLRLDFSGFNIEDLEGDRPVIIKERTTNYYTFTGSKINRTIHFIMSLAGIQVSLSDASSCLHIDIDNGYTWKTADPIFEEIYADIDFHLENTLVEKPSILNFSKWGYLLPKLYQVKILKSRYFDFEGAMAFLRSVNWVYHD